MRVARGHKLYRHARECRVANRRNPADGERASRHVARLEHNGARASRHALHRGEARYRGARVRRDQELPIGSADRDAVAGRKLKRPKRHRGGARHSQESCRADAA